MTRPRVTPIIIIHMTITRIIIAGTGEPLTECSLKMFDEYYSKYPIIEKDKPYAKRKK